MKTKPNAHPIATSDFYYDLFDGGYIKPSEFLEEDDAQRVNSAIHVIYEFQNALNRAELINEV